MFTGPSPNQFSPLLPPLITTGIKSPHLGTPLGLFFFLLFSSARVRPALLHDTRLSGFRVLYPLQQTKQQHIQHARQPCSPRVLLPLRNPCCRLRKATAVKDDHRHRNCNSYSHWRLMQHRHVSFPLFSLCRGTDPSYLFTGPIQCCNSVQSAKSSGLVAQLLKLLGVVLADLNVDVGVTCSPISVAGIGNGEWYVRSTCDYYFFPNVLPSLAMLHQSAARTTASVCPFLHRV